ncbi:MAG: hypothetical protein ABJH93_10695, partial [Roseibium sp.]|uniref:hypothetical protein n=1 Tax=Roseibium sp. TaxID=1936156 RepID=UPI0032986390
DPAAFLLLVKMLCRVCGWHRGRSFHLPGDDGPTWGTWKGAGRLAINVIIERGRRFPPHDDCSPELAIPRSSPDKRSKMGEADYPASLGVQTDHLLRSAEPGERARIAERRRV